MSNADKKRIGFRGWLVIGATGLLTAVILALVGLLYTEAGLRWVVSQAEARSPGELRVGQAEGQLAGPLRLTDIRYRNDDIRVELDSLSARWRLGLLLLGTAQIDQLELDGLRIVLPEADGEPDATPPTLPESLRVPLRINLSGLHLTALSVEQGGESLFQLDELFLDGLAQGHRLRLDRLTASGADLAVDAEGRLQMAGDWPVTLDADWRLSLPDLPALAGSTHLSGDQQSLRIDQQLDQPFHIRARGDIHAPLGALRAELNVRFRDLEPALLYAEAPPARLSGQMDVSGGLDHFRLRGHVDATDTPWGDLGLRGNASLPADLAWLTLHDLQLHHQQYPMELTASGELREPLGEDPFVDLRLAWEQLAWPLEDPEYVAELGEATLQGHLSDYRLELSSHLGWLGEHPEITGPFSGEVHTRLTGSDDRADIDTFELQLDDGPDVAFSGQADWSEGGEFLEGDFRIAALDPSRVLADWPGRLDAAGHVRLAWGGEALRGRLSLTTLDGELIGKPLAGGGSLAYDGTRLRFDDLFLSLGESHLRADGELAAAGRSAIRFDLALDDLSEFPVGASGRLRAEGKLSGSLDQLDLRLAASGDSLRHDELTIEHFDLSLDLRDSGHGDSHVTLVAKAVEYGEQMVRRIELTGDGQRDDHRLRLMVIQDLVQLGVSVAGQLSPDNNWDGQLVDLRLSNEAVGNWQQKQPTGMAAGPDGGRLENTCLVSDDQAGRLCFSGEASEEGHWRADIEGDGFPLALFLDRDATGVQLEGSMDLLASAHDAGQGVHADGRLVFSPGLIRQQVDGEPVTLLAINGGEADFAWTPAEARGELALDLTDGGHVRARAELPAGIDGPLQGRLDANIPQLGLLPVLVAEVGRAEGQLLLSVDIAGRLNDPAFSGDIRVVDARLNLPDLGITAEAVNVHARGGMNALAVDASAESGGGDLRFSAELERLEDGWQGDANLAGERFLGLNIPDARVRISPDLDMNISPGQRMDVSGVLHVPWARITPSDLRAAVQPSPDEVLVGELEEAGHRDDGWAIHSRVRTSLGDDVHFDGYGLTGRITGALDIRDQPGALTRATGELEVRDGHYEAWRQRLEVERGRLFFSDSPIGDPALDIRAVRRPRNVVVGVNIRGTLRQPELDLFSDPAMQQSEQLSYLLTGRPLTEGGEGDMNLIREASLALQVAGGAAVGRRLGRRLGVDTVTIEAGDTAEETQVVFGEYLSPRLFISYGIGLFEGTNVFRIRYEISSRWFLEAQTGPRSGADFIYSLERG